MSLELAAFDEQVVLAAEVFGLGEIDQLEEVREALEPFVDAAAAMQVLADRLSFSSQ